MKPEDYNALYAKFLAGNCTQEEENILFSYAEKLDIQDFHNEQKIDRQQEIKGEIYSKINMGMIRKKRLWPWKYAVAASILILVTIGLYTMNQPEAVKEPNLVQIRAGGNRATLSLGNGKEIDLTKITNGTVYKTEGLNITKTDSGQIRYSVTASSNGPLAYHTIRTPLGGEYQLLLPDGTKVWLNAMSSLKFPSQFKGTKREVELVGEAYFEVSKNAEMPFSVSTKAVEVKVLGTHFNVMAYPEDPSTQTTLLEGSVTVSTPTRTVVLAPGELGTVLQGSANEIGIKKVNTEDQVAWKNGYFVFKKENIKTIMAKVARWYGVDVVYQGNVENIRLGGTVSRAENITDLLKKLELTGAVNFKIEGRKIYVVNAKAL